MVSGDDGGLRGDARAFPDPAAFPFVATLERAFASILAELRALPAAAFTPSPDSLTAAAGGYDERGWRWCGLAGDGPDARATAVLARCPATAAALGAVPGLADAGFSSFLPGTHLYPHHGERRGVLRCHLGLLVPDGDAGIAAGGAVRRWHAGRCLILDDTFEHTAWNHTAGERVVLLVTFVDTRGGGGLDRT